MSHLFIACAVILGLSQDPSLPQETAPYELVLKGDEAKEVEVWRKELVARQRKAEFKEAIRPAQQILAVRNRVQGAEHWQTADARRAVELCESIAVLPAETQSKYAQMLQGQDKADEFMANAQYGAAEPLYRETLAVRQQILGEDHPETARSYNNVAATLNAQDKYAKAEPLLLKALEIRQRVLGENHPETATSYHNLAYNLNGRGKYSEAEPYYRKALVIHERVWGKGHPRTATSYDGVAANLNAQGKYAEAEPLFHKALEIRQRVPGVDHHDTATSYNNVAANLDNQGKYAEAEPLYRKALEIRQRLLGDHRYTAHSYNNLAFNLNAQGRYAAADPLYREALAIHLRVPGVVHHETALYYNNVAENLRAQGKYGEAEPLLREALEICDTRNHHYAASIRTNLAINLQAQGKHADAEPLLRKSLESWELKLGKDHPLTANGYNNVAYNLYAQGKYAEADSVYRIALEIRQCVLGENHPHTARCYGNLAANLNAQGKYVEAEEMWSKEADGFQNARVHVAFAGIDRATFDAERSPLAALAAIRARLGRYEPAWRALEAYLARGLLDDVSARRFRPMTAQELDQEQVLLRKLQQLDAKLSALLSAQANVESQRDSTKEVERQRDELLFKVKEFYQLMTGKYGVAAGEVYNLESIQKQLPADTALVTWVDFPGQNHAADPNGEHWACVVRHRGEPVWVKLDRNGPRGAWTEEDNKLPDEMRELLANHTKQSDPRWRDVVGRLYRQRLEPVERVLGILRDPAGTPAVSNGREPELPVRRLVILPSIWMRGIPIEVLTDKYTISYAPSGTLFAWLREQRKETRPDPAQLHLLALANPKFPEPPKSGSKAPPPEHGVVITHVVPSSNAAKAKLRRGDVLLGYADKKLEDPQDLVVAIEESSNVTRQNPTPVATPLPGDGAKGDMDNTQPAVAPAAIELAVWREGERVVLHVQPGKLGVGLAKDLPPQALAAQRAEDELVRGAAKKYYPRLPGTRAEVDAIARLFPLTKKLLDADATERTLQDLTDNGELRQFRYLHLATHGEMNAERAMLSSLILADLRSSDSLDVLVPGQRYYDGRLTAAEMIRWNLDAELVTLSACQTALGRYAGGEGYLGFSQALLLAGARSLVLSLWKVDDTATALLMIRFYQNLLGKRDGLRIPMPKAEALAEAKWWLRGLPEEELGRLVVRYKLPPPGPRGESSTWDAAANCPLQQRKPSLSGQRGPGPYTILRPNPVTSSRRYEHPHYWAAFILIGDPD